MKLIKTEDAVGHVLCHDITQIVKGVTKDVLFRKGHRVDAEDIPALLRIGKENLYVWEQQPDMLHEDEAADILRQLCQNDCMNASPPKEGKIELTAAIDGLFLVDTERLRKVNSFGEMMIATRVSGTVVKKGDKLCGTRVIPLVIKAEKMNAVSQLTGSEPLLRLVPIKEKKFGVVTTGSEVYHGRIKDTFTPVLQEKLREFGAVMTEHVILDDNHVEITAAINRMLSAGCDMVLCSGGMSVDPDDRTPLAIKNTGADIISYGAAVLPGAMFLLAYDKEKRPICGLPGCVMYSKRTIFDIILPFLLADIPVTKEQLAGLGNGGLCLGCEICHFPNCMFGKGV